MIKKYLADMNRIIADLDIASIYLMTTTIQQAKDDGKYIYIFGNGGSGSTASHFASDISKSCGIKAFCLNDPIPALTAWANDTEYSKIFENGLSTLVNKGDIVVGISGSGNSPNILNGIKKAKSLGAFTIGLTAFGGGKLKDVADLAIIVPTQNMEQAEDCHLMICHIIKTLLLEKE
jgi:D-sedoheptulose 7-phosphate isomerase